MQADDFDAHRERLDAATKELNEGKQIPEVEAAWIERAWDLTSQFPREERHNRAIGLAAIAGGNPDAAQISPEKQVALMFRLLLLDALLERGLLDEYVSDESERKKVVAAAASINCDKNDLGEALAQRHLRELPPELAQKAREELRLAGHDPDRPKIGERFVEWIRDNS